MTFERWLYLIFYDELVKELYTKFITKKAHFKGKGEKSPSIWTTTVKDENQNFFVIGDKFLGNKTGDRSYFYRKYIEFNPSPKAKIEAKLRQDIDDLSLLKAFEFLGYKLPQNKEKLKDEEKAKALYEIYRKKKNEFKSEKNTEEKITENDLQTNINHIVNTEEGIIYELINKFYSAVSVKQFSVAWDCLSIDFKKRIWNDDYKKFEKGYFFFRELQNLHIFLLKKTGSFNFECMVYYESEIDLPSIVELGNIHRITVERIGEIVDEVESLKNKVNRLGGSGIEKRQVSRLFHPSAIEFIWFTSEIDPVLLKTEFDTITTNPPIPMLFKCKFLKIDNDWYISGILPIHC